MSEILHDRGAGLTQPSQAENGPSTCMSNQDRLCQTRPSPAGSNPKVPDGGGIIQTEERESICTNLLQQHCFSNRSHSSTSASKHKVRI